MARFNAGIPGNAPYGCITVLREFDLTGRMAFVRGRLAKWIVVVALVVSVGGHWGILQTVAWIGMAVEFSRDASISVALEKTFNGKNPCKVCKLVEQGKKAEADSDAKLDSKKVELFHLAAFEFFFPSLHQPLITATVHSAPRAEAPLLPPPRLS